MSSIFHPCLSWPGLGVCEHPYRAGPGRVSSGAQSPLGEGVVPGPCLWLMVPSPAESWPSCLSTCNGPAMGAYGPWRCGGRQYLMERPPATRPLPPATGQAAPPSALGKGRGPLGSPPPLASPPLLPFSVLSSLRPASSYSVSVWACFRASWASSRGLGGCRQMARLVQTEGLPGEARLDSPFCFLGLQESEWERCPHHPSLSSPPFMPLSSFFLCFHVPLTLPSLHPHPSREAGERRRPLATGAYGSGNRGHHPGL